MLNDEELSAIEDWRFLNRIDTRADAIRRLIQLGLDASKGGTQVPEDLPLRRPPAC